MLDHININIFIKEFFNLIRIYQHKNRFFVLVKDIIVSIKTLSIYRASIKAFLGEIEHFVQYYVGSLICKVQFPIN